MERWMSDDLAPETSTDDYKRRKQELQPAIDEVTEILRRVLKSSPVRNGPMPGKPLDPRAEFKAALVFVEACRELGIEARFETSAEMEAERHAVPKARYKARKP
jgi:hypothetical protein